MVVVEALKCTVLVVDAELAHVVCAGSAAVALGERAELGKPRRNCRGEAPLSADG